MSYYCTHQYYLLSISILNSFQYQLEDEETSPLNYISMLKEPENGFDQNEDSNFVYSIPPLKLHKWFLFFKNIPSTVEIQHYISMLTD